MFAMFQLVIKRIIRRYLIHVHGSGSMDTDITDESESQGMLSLT